MIGADLLIVWVCACLAFSYLATRISVWLRPSADQGSSFLVFLVSFVLVSGAWMEYDPAAHSQPLWKDLGVLVGQQTDAPNLRVGRGADIGL